MKRVTQKDELGYYLVGDGIYSDWGDPEKFRGDDVDRLAAIEDILGDEYDLSRLRALAEADREGRCVLMPTKEEQIKKGMTIWYVDSDTGEIEEGKVFSVNYKDGCLDSFSVDFKLSKDFDEFCGDAWRKCFFGSLEQAEAALWRKQDG